MLEDCEFVGNTFAGAEVRDEGTRATFRRCVSRDNNGSGFLFQSNATGLVDDCEAIANGLSGIQIRDDADPLVRASRFRRNRHGGGFIYESGRGRFDDCLVEANAFAGFEIREGGHPEVRRSTITGTTYEAIWIGDAESGGVFEGNDLRGNDRGAWDIAEGAEKNLTRRDNQE